MEGREKPEIIYSDPVKDIMGRPPRKILRRGTTVIFLVFLLLFILAWIIKYPDVIRAEIEITTENPPVPITARVTGRIKNLYVSDHESIPPGKLLGIIETTASQAEIGQLKMLIDTITRPELLRLDLTLSFTNLGEIQNQWAAFQKYLSDYQTFIRNDYYGYKIISTNEEISSLRQYIERIRIKEKLFIESQSLEERKFRRDSLLYVQKVFSESEFENAHQDLLRNKIELQQVRLDHSTKLIELATKNQLLQDYRILGQAEKDKLLSVLKESFLNLKAQIKIWENNYLLISSVGGKVTFTSIWHIDQNVMKDQPVLNIVPADAGDYIGRVSLRMQRSGKVRPGLPVNIKLSGYPYLEYGMLRGIVRSISLVPSGDAYVIEINLPDGFRTLYGKELEFTQNMQGIAEIITEDTRLLQKIINPFRHLAALNKKLPVISSE